MKTEVVDFKKISTDDIARYYTDTLVTIKGKGSVVWQMRGVAPHGDDDILKLHFKKYGGRVTEVLTKAQASKVVNVAIPDGGVINTKDCTIAVFMQRKPSRQWKKAYRTNMHNVVPLIDCRHGARAEAHHVLKFTDLFFPVYLSFEEAYEKLLVMNAYSIAIDKHIWLSNSDRSSHPCVIGFNDNVVGYVDSARQVHIYVAFSYLQHYIDVAIGNSCRLETVRGAKL